MTVSSHDAEPDERQAAQAGCRLTDLIAASRHARVHAVEWRGGTAILKVATAATRADPVARARFDREGRLGLGLHHPNLVGTLAHGAGWILLADLRGDAHGAARDLHALAGVPDHVPRLAPLAAALAHLHARGLVHRDVKPGNVLIDPRGELVLIDLGIVGLRGRDGLGPDEVAGSPAWMAPEQIHGAAPQPEADAWSLAAVIGSTASGLAPFAGTADAVLDARRSGGPPDAAFLEGVRALPEPALADLVRAGLSEDARARPSMAAFAQRLTAAARP